MVLKALPGRCHLWWSLPQLPLQRRPGPDWGVQMGKQRPRQKRGLEPSAHSRTHSLFRVFRETFGLLLCGR